MVRKALLRLFSRPIPGADDISRTVDPPTHTRRDSHFWPALIQDNTFIANFFVYYSALSLLSSAWCEPSTCQPTSPLTNPNAPHHSGSSGGAC